MPPIQFTNSNTEYITQITTWVQNLIISGGAPFLAEGITLLNSLAVIMLVIYGLKWAAASISGHHSHFDLVGALHFFSLFVVAEGLMRFYLTPLPWGGSSVSMILPNTGRHFAGLLDLSSLNMLLGQISGVINHMETPAIYNIPLAAIYFMVLGFLVVMAGVLFCITILAPIAIGVGILTGTLVIPFLVVPRMSWLFWMWLSYMLKYSFYQVVASALIYIWSNILLWALQLAVHGDYSLAHMGTLLLPLGVLSTGMFYSVFKVGALTNDLFSGAASTGSSIGSSLSSQLAGAFK